MSGTYIQYPESDGGPVEGVDVLSTGVGAGLVLAAVGDGTSAWTAVAGTGDVVGPAAATDNGFARFDGTTGKLIQNTGTGSNLSDAGTATFAQIIDSGLTASKPVFSDGSKQLTSTGTVPIANGGTNSTTSLNNNRIMQSSGSAIVEAAAITASRALISDANGIPTHATTTSTEIGYVNGVTSAIQTQIDAKAPAASPTFSGTITTPLTASKVVTLNGSSQLAASTITAAALELLAPAEYNAGNSSTAITLDWTNGTAQKVTLTGSVTFTLSNPVTGTAYVIRIATGAGSFTATWPMTVLWPGGTAPTITATASKVDLINLYWDGTSYYGSFAQNY